MEAYHPTAKKDGEVITETYGGGMRVQQSKVQRCIKDVQCGRVRDREIEVECEVIMCVSFQFVRLGERLRYVCKR